MTREEAKLILQVYRPGDEAAVDSQLGVALALAKTDPELSEWFAREQSWDAGLRRGLQTVPVPVDLKAQILAAQKIVPVSVVKEPSSRSLWQSPALWAMAAAVVILLGFAFVWTRSQPAGNLADFADAMILASPVDAHHVDVDNSNLQQVKTWLADHHAVADIDLPTPIKDAPGLMGCRVMNWHGHPVSMLCFMMSGQQHVDLFVTPASALADAPLPGQPRFAMVDQQMTAGWRNGSYVYLMTGKVSGEFLRQCLQSPTAATISRNVSLAASY